MNKSIKQFCHMFIVSTSLLFGGCTIAHPYHSYHSASGPYSDSLSQYSVTPYRPDRYAQNSFCTPPNSDALVEWAHGASGGEQYHQRKINIQVNGRSKNCFISEKAGSYYGRPLPTYDSDYYYYDY